MKRDAGSTGSPPRSKSNGPGVRLTGPLPNALIVRSDLKDRGIGWGLMRHLIRYAESEGLRDLHGDVLAANQQMLKMCRELGFDIAANSEDLSLRKVSLKLPLSAAKLQC
jgi:GNAT superfamily N-acetyltransferase